MPTRLALQQEVCNHILTSDDLQLQEGGQYSRMMADTGAWCGRPVTRRKDLDQVTVVGLQQRLMCMHNAHVGAIADGRHPWLQACPEFAQSFFMNVVGELSSCAGNSPGLPLQSRDWHGLYGYP